MKKTTETAAEDKAWTEITEVEGEINHENITIERKNN